MKSKDALNPASSISEIGSSPFKISSTGESCIKMDEKNKSVIVPRNIHIKIIKSTVKIGPANIAKIIERKAIKKLDVAFSMV